MRSSFWLGAALTAASVQAFGPPLHAENAPSDVQATFVDPNSPEAKSYRLVGEYAIDRLVVTMITDSAKAVSDHTEVAALSTFHLKDVPMKNGTVAGLPRITAMKLTSLKLRNPTNAPDEAEQLALDQVRIGLTVGSPPRVLVQKIEHPSRPVEWRVYKPLANVRQCGNCHGNPDDMSPELREALQKKYPDDKATEYAVGEWRGVIRVTVADPPPAPKPAAAAAPKK